MTKRTTFIGTALLLALPVTAYSQTQTPVEPAGATQVEENRTAAPVEVLPLKGDAAAMPRKVKADKAPAKAADLSKWKDRKFKGGLIFSNTWENMSITEVPYGVYEFTIGEESVAEQSLYTTPAGDWMAGARSGDEFYGTRPVSMFGALTSVAYDVIDLKTNTAKAMRFMDSDGTPVNFSGIASVQCFSPLDNQIYAVVYNEDLTGQNWATFDRENLRYDVICPFNGKFNVMGLAATPSGQIYCISADGDLYTVNKANGRVSLVGPTGVGVAAYTQSMEYDGRTGTFLWAAVTNRGSMLYSVDPATGAAQEVSRFDNGEQIVGLYFDEFEGQPEAPAAVSNFAVNIDAPEALAGNFSMTLPTLTGEGNSLSGNVNVTLALDGEVLADDVAYQPGSQVTVPFSTTEGNHYIAVYVRNAGGNGPMTIVRRYFGYDYPNAVTDLTFAQENGQANVTWTAANGGQNEGYIDPARLSYQVWRMPENVKVADNLRETSFTEQLPATVRHYFYKVIAFNGADYAGAPAESNSILFGSAFEVPYERLFDSDAADDDYTILDLDGDGYTWNKSGWNPEMDVNVTNVEGGQNNDWLITPNIRLEAGKVYRFTVNLMCPFPTYPEHWVMAYASEINPESTDNFTVFKDWVVTDKNDFYDYDATFSVPTTGDYYLGIGYKSTQGNGSMLRLKSEKLTLVGNAQAPDAITELTINADADGEPTAVISFNAPANNMAGNNLSGSFNIDVYRNGEKVRTFENVAAGSAQSFTDNVTVPGYQDYRFLASNSFGEGMPVDVREFVGMYEPPYVRDCADKSVLEDFSLICDGFEDDPNYSALTYSDYNQSLQLSRFNSTGNDEKMYVVFPAIRFDNETVYHLSYNVVNSHYSDVTGNTYAVMMGDRAAADAFTTKVADMPITEYSGADVLSNLVVTDGGRKYLSFYVNSKIVNDYTSMNFKNIAIEKFTSAKAPFTVQNLKATPDQGGAVKATVAFNAPAVDFAGRALSTIGKIEIFRGENNPVPAKVFENVEPGTAIEWLDEQPATGMNRYLVVATNSYGRGEASTVDVYAGFDAPQAVPFFSIVPTKDNQRPVFTWSRPEEGVNHGVLDYEHLTYAIAKVDPNATEQEDQIQIIAQGLTGTQYEYKREATDTQELCYYAILVQTPQGVSAANMYFTILGKPYEIPFAESFAAGEPKSQMWLFLGTPGALQAGPTAGESMSQFNAGPQDGDNGAFFFLNGSYSDYRQQFAVFSPKFNVRNAVSPVLSFWLYKGNQSGSYGEAPTLNIQASNDETEFTDLGTIIWNETTPEWVKYEYPLSQFTSKDGALIFQFTAAASGYADIIFMDNFAISGESGINDVDGDASMSVFGATGGILTRGAAGKTVRVFGTDGSLRAAFEGTDRMTPMAPGMYIVTISGRSWKVIVK